MMTIATITARLDPTVPHHLTVAETRDVLRELATLAWHANERALSMWLDDISESFVNSFAAHRAPCMRLVSSFDGLAQALHPDTDGPTICKLAARVLAPWGGR